MPHPITSQPAPPPSTNTPAATSSSPSSTSPPDEQEFGLLIATITNSTGWFITAESRSLVQPLNFAGFKDELREKGFKWAVTPVGVPGGGRGKKLVATHLKDKGIEDVWLLVRQMEEGVSVLKRELELKEDAEGRERLLSRVVEGEVRKLFSKVHGEADGVSLPGADAQLQGLRAEDEGKGEILAVKESGDGKASLLLLDAEGRVKIDGEIEMKGRDLEEDELRAQLLATKVEAEKAERAKLRERYAQVQAELVELRSKRQDAHDKGLTAQEKRFRNEIEERRKTLKHLEELGSRAAKKKNNGNAIAQAQRVEKAQPEEDEMAQLEQQAASLRVEAIEFKQKRDEARAKSDQESESKFQKTMDERRRVLNLVVSKIDEGKESVGTVAQPVRSEKSKFHEQTGELRADMAVLGRRLVKARAKSQKMEEVRLPKEIGQRKKAFANLGHAADKADGRSSAGSTASRSKGLAQKKEETQWRMRQDVKGAEMKRKAPNEGSSDGSSMKKQKLGRK